MVNNESMVIEQAFEMETGVSIYTAMKILNDDVEIYTEDLSYISNMCKNVLADEIERRNIPYEYRFLLLSIVFCRMFKTSTDFHKEYMKSVKNVLDGKDLDIEIVKKP